MPATEIVAPIVYAAAKGFSPGPNTTPSAALGAHLQVRGALPFVNGNAWLNAATISATWAAVNGENSVRLVTVLPIMAAFGFCSDLTYALVGAMLRQWLSHGNRLEASSSRAPRTSGRARRWPSCLPAGVSQSPDRTDPVQPADQNRVYRADAHRTVGNHELLQPRYVTGYLAGRVLRWQRPHGRHALENPNANGHNIGLDC